MTQDEIDDKLLTQVTESSDVEDEEINELIKISSDSEHTVSYHLLELELVDEYEMRGLLEAATGAESFDPNYLDWEPREQEEFTRLLPAEFLQKNMIFPINKKENTIGVAMLNPTDRELKTKIQARTGCRVKPYVAHEKAFYRSFDKNLAGVEEQETTVDFDEYGYCFEPVDELRKEVANIINREDNWRTDDSVFNSILHRTPVLLLVQEIMNQIMWKGGSDIHFEPFEDHFRIRVRRDGELRTLWEFPPSFGPTINGRILLASDLKPRPAEKPRDARIGYSLIYEREIEYRVAVLPTLFGEKIVLRAIDLDEGSIPLDVMGFSDRDLKVLRRGFNQPTGMVLVTGPTGSGKTTSLYSILDERNEESVAITTAEDPVEARLESVSQVSCSGEEGGGVTFAEALKSFLRQDPDIIMVGEIRDKETGEIAVEAAMTGHLVLSTLHTNSAAETVNRLINMQIPPYMITAGLYVVVAQRLIRTLCDNCKQETDPPTEIMERYDIDPDKFSETTFYEAVGCEECDQGFDGRTGLFEVLEITDNIREAIFNRESTAEIEQRAKEQGFTTLLEDGFKKVRQGITTLEEVMKNTV